MDILSDALKLGVTPAIIVVIYLIITKIIETRKESKRIILNAEVVTCFTKLNGFLDYFTKDIINKETDKCNFAIKNSFKALANTVIKHCTYTIISNNIELNKEIIIDNIQRVVNTEFSNLYSNLYLYNVNGNKVTDYIDNKWKDEMINFLIDIIYTSNLTKEQKLYNLNNKCNIRINDYCILVCNKYMEHGRDLH